MQVKKIFDVSSKQFTQKPPYVKPKYKTYRQLLELDKPKKIVLEESQDQNDDFLEKMMKKEKKKQQEQKLKLKEKNTSAKSKALSQAKSVAQSKQTTQNNIKKQQHQNIKSRVATSKSNQNEVNLLQKGFNQEKETTEVLLSKDVDNQNSEQNIQKCQKGEVYRKTKVVIKKRNSSEGSLVSNIMLTSKSKSSQKIDNQQSFKEKLLKSYQQQANQMIKHNFFPSHQLKKAEGFKQLHKNTHPQNKVKTLQNLIETKLNPQKNRIEHKMSPLKNRKENQISYSERANNFLLKSASSNSAKMLTIMDRTCINQESKYKAAMIQRKSLFKNSYQQELFLKSLKKKERISY